MTNFTTVTSEIKRSEVRLKRKYGILPVPSVWHDRPLSYSN
jgi:hypothetical protein